MPFSLLLDEAAVLPLRAIVFQCLLLLVAIALEAIVLRQRLRLGFQSSMQYAATLNLLAVVLGWILFLGLEQILPPAIRTQVISYVLFGNFYFNDWAGSLGIFVVIAGLVVFFLTFWVKATALAWLTLMLGNPIVQPKTEKNVNRYRYRRSLDQQTTVAPHEIAVLQANALSFSAVLLLLLLRYGVTQSL
ncbi:MAG: filament integrity protein FraC [Leptolyngbyaceae cyanobacterium]